MREIEREKERGRVGGKRKKNTHEKQKKRGVRCTFIEKLKDSPTLATMKKRAQDRRE